MKSKVHFMKTLIALFLSITVYFTSSGLMEVGAYEIASLRVAGMVKAQERAVEASQAFFSSLRQKNDGDYEYPVSFAGIWIDQNELYIGFTDPDSLEADQVRIRLAEYKDVLKVVKQKYSFSYLVEAGQKMVSQVKQKYGRVVTMMGVDEKENALVIGIERASFDIVKGDNLFRDSDIPVRIEPRGFIQEAAALTGGSKIYNQNRKAYYSVSVGGTYNGYTVFVSCGHNNQQVGDTIRINNINGNILGSVKYKRYAHNLYGDFEFVQLVSSYYSTSNQVAPGKYATSTNSNPAIGTFVYFYGHASANYGNYGQYYATVSLRYTEAALSNSINVKGLTQASLQYGAVYDGDSGGAVYVGSGTNVSYAGVIHGRDYRNPTNPLMYFTPYVYLSSAGFSCKLN